MAYGPDKYTISDVLLSQKRIITQFVLEDPHRGVYSAYKFHTILEQGLAFGVLHLKIDV